MTNWVFSRRAMPANMLDEIVRAIKMREPELLLFDDVDVKHFKEVREKLRRPFSNMEGYGFR